MDIRSFYERDDVSRVCPGVKDTVTCCSLKKQKRLLNDSIKNMHEKLMKEGNSVSYSLFCRIRPFWVLPAMENDRQTCLCAIHENTGFVVNAMKNVRLIDLSNLQVLASRNMVSRAVSDVQIMSAVTVKEQKFSCAALLQKRRCNFSHVTRAQRPTFVTVSNTKSK